MNPRNRFEAEAAYAHSIFQDMLGDTEASVAVLERAVEHDPTYAPAILSLGSVEFQRGRSQAGRELFRSLLSLPPGTEDLCEIIGKAGTFLIQIQAHADGLELFRDAVAMFPDEASLHSGVGCCAGHQGLHAEAIASSERALELEPDSQEFMNDLGWALCEAGRLRQAVEVLERAVTTDPSDELARENLRICYDRTSSDAAR